MGIEIEMTGSGQLGEITPGWSVQEYATPVTIGNTAGGTGNVLFNASAKDDSLFVVNNNITTTEEFLGSISGVVKSVSQTGLNVTVNHDTKLAAFDASRDIPALGSGSVYSAIDLCSRLASTGLTKSRDGIFYSLQGHSAGFDYAGALVEPVIIDGSFQQYDRNNGIFYPEYFRQQYGSIWGYGFYSSNNKLWSSNISGDTLSNNAGIPTSRIAFKTQLDTAGFNWGFSPIQSTTPIGKGTRISVYSNAAGYLTVSGEVLAGGMTSSFQQNSDMTTVLDVTKELAVFIEYTMRNNTTPYVLTVKVCNTSDYSTMITINQNITADYTLYNLPWTLSGHVRSMYRHQGKDLGAWVPEDYDITADYVYTDGIIAGPPVAAQQNVNMWEYLQQACATYSQEISVTNNMVTVRPIGLNVLDITDKTVPTIAPNITMGGRNVEVVYSSSYNSVSEEMYNAYDDNNRVLSVKVDEEITTTVPISGTPTVVYLPSRAVSSTGIPNPGEYAVCDSKGVQVPQYLWTEAGGRVDVKISTTTYNAIDIILHGPSSTFVNPIGGGGTPFGGATPLYAGPFKIAYTSGTKDYAALSILGSGVKTTPKTLKIRTAADDNKIAQDVAKTITNPFISTQLQAYDRGEWAICEASGPRVTMSASISVNAANAFGLNAGSLVRYRDSIYRVTDSTIGNLGVSFNATRHVTVKDFDAVWNGHNVGTHDSLWNGYSTSDQVIRPLWFVGDDESVVMFLDTDVNPYYDFDGDPEISVFPDTDMNPFYVDGGNIDGEDDVLLDTDENPYDGGAGYGS